MAEYLGRHSSVVFNFDSSFEGEVRKNEPMSRHTTYHIGGNAKYFITVNSVSALSSVLSDCVANDLPWVVVGQGSNYLVADEGYDGVVVNLSGDFRNWRFDEERLVFSVGAGMALSRIVQEAFHMNVTGLEFCVGTPGTVGGALRMNAGSRNEWLGKQVRSVTTFSVKDGLKRYYNSDIEWSYRSNSIPADEVVVECELVVERGMDFAIRGKMEGALARRKKTQPLGYPSCGSVFRNPDGDSAGRLIEAVGLKGHAIGGAQISEKHANFIINTGNATAADVIALMVLAQNKVREAYGIELSPEVRFLGF